MNLADQLARIEQAPKGPNVGAFFDLDGTLVAGYTATAFFREQVTGRHVDPTTALRSLIAAVDGTFLGGSPIKGSQLAFAALAGKDESLLADLGERLFRTQIAGTIRAEARDLVRAHQRAGHTVVVSSAATRYQIGPVARDLGIEDLICTELEVHEGLLTGAIRGRMRWGREKASGVRAYARTHGVDLSHSFAYGNGTEDIDFLATVGQPTALSPDTGLSDAAARFGWPVLRLSDPPPSTLAGSVRTLLALNGMNVAAMTGAAWGLLTGDRRRGVNAATALATDSALKLAGVHLRITGLERLAAARPGIVVANHQSSIDPVVIAAILRGDFTAVAKKEAKYDPRALLGSLLLDPVYIDRGNSEQARASLDAVADRIRSGTSLMIFPEGTRSPTPVLGPFRKGAFHLAVATGAPVIPIVLRNTGEIMPRGARTIRAGTIDVHVLEPRYHWSTENMADEVASLHAEFVETLAHWPEEA